MGRCGRMVRQILVRLESDYLSNRIYLREKMTITITDRWGNETKNPSLPVLTKTIEDVFLDNALPEISISDGYFYLDIKKNGWIYLSDEDGGAYYMKNLDGEKIRQLWRLFHEGYVDDIVIEPSIKGIPAFNGDW